MAHLRKIYDSGPSDLRRTAKRGVSLLVSHPPAEPHRFPVGLDGDVRVIDISRPGVDAAPNVRIGNGDSADPVVNHRQADRAAVEVGPRKNVVTFFLHPGQGPQQMVRQGNS